MFEASNVALQFVTAVRPIVEAIVDRDRNLAEQLEDAATSSALNTAESGRREGADRRHRARIASAECDEAIIAIRIADAWGWPPKDAVANALALGDRLQAILWRLRHPRR